ncbi:unnamed protein product [Darwinula stevensoni]|uniref:FAD dependent oxidoreductase domain-containing protein n=1 Tax=Darwinula stevensoni TaxID=69355 RepID=A0A7R9FQ23_9CRUS|nr:unnamed protein product [Darwinula stevensoni]CAG0898941.1 unnamed protein product [Darwinula stevensoni]
MSAEGLHGEEMDLDVVVIGAGIMGSWAGLNLVNLSSHDSLRVAIIEQFPLPHARGSSHGQSRIYRLAYPERHQTVLARDSLQAWLQLQHAHPLDPIITRHDCIPSFLLIDLQILPHTVIVTIDSECPLLRIADEASHGTIERCLDSLAASCPKGTYRALSKQDLLIEFPWIVHGHSDLRGLLDSNARILRADKCIRYVQEEFQKNGGKILDGMKITGVEMGDTVTVTGEREGESKEIRCRNLIVCTGAWSSNILSFLGIHHAPLQPMKMAVPYFKIKPGHTQSQVSMVMEIQALGHFYSTPQLEYPGLIKVAPDHGVAVDPDLRDMGDVSAEVERTSRFVAAHLPGLDPRPAIVETCMYTMTPDKMSILDRHPQWPNISFATGFSGMGFKLSPYIGKVLASWAMGQEVAYDLIPLQLNRFEQSHIASNF